MKKKKSEFGDILTLLKIAGSAFLIHHFCRKISIDDAIDEAIKYVKDHERKDGPLSDTTVDQVLNRGRP